LHAKKGSRTFKVQENDRGDERRKEDHRPCREIEIERPIFNQNTIFLFKTKKLTISAPMHLIDGLTPDLSLSISNGISFLYC
jgi:hypothetical protein